MQNWQRSLDRYLTSEPPDDFTPWVERVWEYISDTIISAEDYEQNEKLFDKWGDYLFNKGYSPYDASILIAKTWRRKKLFNFDHGKRLTNLWLLWSRDEA